MATHAPSHREGLAHLLDDFDFLDVAVAVRTLYSSGYMSHVGELDMVRDLVNSVPGDCLLPFKISTQKRNLLRILTPSYESVASHAGSNRRDPSPHRPLSRKVTVLAVNLVVAGMYVVREGNRLLGRPDVSIGYGSRRVLTRWVLLGQKRRCVCEDDECRNRQEGALLLHGRSLHRSGKAEKWLPCSKQTPEVRKATPRRQRRKI